jgi:arylformamidase
MRFLSHPLGAATPPVGDEAPVLVEPVSLIAQGATFNVHRLTLINHIGTHFDAPWHVNPHGARVTDLDPSWFSYAAPHLLDVPKGDDELIAAADLTPHAAALAGADAIFVRTGYAEAVRASDPRRYGSRSPGFAADAAEVLLALPQLRAVGLDAISATAPGHVEEGIAFHRAMLGQRADDRFVLLVEDMLLASDLTAADLARGAFMAPLLLDGLDGAPTTVVAW